jgi:hypothetical protein
VPVRGYSLFCVILELLEGFLPLVLLVYRFKVEGSCLVGFREIDSIPEERLLVQGRILFYNVFY